jgi:hypothetical protein
MSYIVENWEHIAAIALGAHALASAITAMTPTPEDDKWVAKVYKIVEMLALVVGKAKHGGDDKSVS